MNIHTLDRKVINFSRKIAEPAGRISLFIVYFWFGILKILDLSPASPLVQSLFEKTMGGMMSFETFLTLFGVFEMLIGVMFLVKGFERIALIFLSVHMITTFMPLIMVPTATWTGFMTPTLEGQYIIKNSLIIAVALYIAGNLRPLASK